MSCSIVHATSATQNSYGVYLEKFRSALAACKGACDDLGSGCVAYDFNVRASWCGLWGQTLTAYSGFSRVDGGSSLDVAYGCTSCDADNTCYLKVREKQDRHNHSGSGTPSCCYPQKDDDVVLFSCNATTTAKFHATHNASQASTNFSTTQRCRFPFTYHGNVYNSCTVVGSDFFWCRWILMCASFYPFGR